MPSLQQVEKAVHAAVGLAGGEGMESGFPSAPTPSMGPLHTGVLEGDINGSGEIVSANGK